MKKFILILMCLSLASPAFANAPKRQHRETLKEKIVGKFVKVFAKTYIATHSLDKIKEKNIKKIRKMDEAKFQRVFTKIYNEMLVDLPQPAKERLGVSAEMTREDAIRQINSFTSKRQIYKIINSVPNRMIAQHFEKHKGEFKKSMKKDGSGVDAAVDQLLEDPQASS